MKFIKIENMKFQIHILSLFLFLMLSSCKSPLSEDEADEVSSIGAKIELSQNLSNKSDNNIIVKLFDKSNKEISNSKIIVKVNGIVLDTVQTKGLYYTTSNFYTKQNVAVSDVYNFEIILTNKEKYFLGSVKPLEEISESDIICDEKGNFNQDFVVKWKNLLNVNELSISKSVLLSTSNETETNYSYEPTVVKKIDRQGKYVIPKSSYKNSKSTISSLEIKFTASRLGHINSKFLKSSEIKITGHIDKSINF